MATNLLSNQSVTLSVRASTDHRQPESNRRRNSSSNWWTPLFGWSSEPDYIDSNNKPDSSNFPVTKTSRPQFAGCFTAEKAKQLRMMTKESETFHDAMYHSAIASRLASDFKNSSDL